MVNNASLKGVIVEGIIAHVILRLEDGSVAENTHKTGRPTRFVFGDGSLTPAIEKTLKDLSVGDKKTFTLPAEDVFGTPVPENVKVLSREQFPEDMQLEKGLIVAFHQPNAVELLGVIQAVHNNEITVDFNHPLSGQPIQFEVEVLEIL